MSAPRGRRRPPASRPCPTAPEDAIALAVDIVDKVAPVFVVPLQTWLDDHPGRPAQLPLRSLFVGMLVNALLGRDALMTRTTEVLRGLPEHWRMRLGVEVDGHLATYRQVWTVWRRSRRGIALLNTLIDDPTLTEVDAANWVLNRIVRATLPEGTTLGGARAIDSTDHEPWARTRGDSENGGRWTKDADVLEGHFPAKNGEPGRVRFLSELHLSVAVREDDGPQVPGITTGAFLGKANVDRIRALLYLVDDETAHGEPVTEVVIDRGYSGAAEEHLAIPLDERGVAKTIDLYPYQRAPQRPFRGAVARDGSLFCPSAPPGLREIEESHYPSMPTGKARALAARFDERQRYAFRVRQAAKVANGATRMECPARAGHVRCPLVPASLRLPLTKPAVAPPDEPPPCCTQATLTVPNDLTVRLRQKHPYGTTKWKAAYNRRPHVESANALIKTHFAAVRRGYSRVFGLAAQALLLAFTLAAANLEYLQSYRYREEVA